MDAEEQMGVEHSPGPWEKDYGGTMGHIKSLGPCGTSPTPTVCLYDVKTPSLTDQMQHANGRLIASAPAMHIVLEACQLGVARIEGTEFCFNGLRYVVADSDWNKVMAVVGWERLREAIAKAKTH